MAKAIQVNDSIFYEKANEYIASLNTSSFINQSIEIKIRISINNLIRAKELYDKGADCSDEELCEVLGQMFYHTFIALNIIVKNNIKIPKSDLYDNNGTLNLIDKIASFLKECDWIFERNKIHEFALQIKILNK